MSGMKFRRTCTVCNSTFFSPDRKAAYCLKCLKKRVVKHVPAEPRVSVSPSPAPHRASAPAPVSVGGGGGGGARRAKPTRAPKAAVLTSDLRERILRLYDEQYATGQMQPREIHTQIANKHKANWKRVQVYDFV